jgi:tRNA G46 methylase TrmB
MDTDARDNELKKLYRERDAKFDEIVSCLQRELHPDAASLTKTDWQQLAEDAEELTDNWASAEADNRLPGVTTELQRLLSEHQEICRRIIDILDTEQPDG